MKKTLIFFVVVLVGFFVAFSYLDQSSDYHAERALWRINKEFRTVRVDPQSVPDAKFDEIAADYGQFLRQYPDSRLAPSAALLQGRVHIAAGKYEAAREIYEAFIEKYKDRPNLAVQALIDIGRTYSLEQDKANVLATYQRMVDEYTLTEPGLKTPLVIAEYHVKEGDYPAAQKAFNEAIDHYKSLAQEHPDTHIEFNASRLLATCYLAQRQWAQAVDLFEEILFKFSQPQYMDPRTADSIIKAINTISVAQLKDIDRAMRVYERFIEEKPKHPFSPVFAELLKGLQMMKEKGLTVEMIRR